MKVEYGLVKEYKVKKGYGYVTRTFDNTIRQDNKDVWFHITTIKYDFPDLARQLDDGLGKDVYFWYLIDTSERDKVEKIWLDSNIIPNHFRDDLIIYIVQLWNSQEDLPLWLKQVTTNLLGKARQEELHLIHLCKKREANDLIQSQTKAQTNDLQQAHIEENKRLELAERMLDKDFYAGLPEDLVNKVFWVERNFRTHPLSHIPGGIDLIIEYYDEQVLAYDWIKRPSLYIAKAIFEYEEWEWDRSYSRNHSYFLDYFRDSDESGYNSFTKDCLFRIFARKEHYKKPGVFGSFREVWNSNTSTSYTDLYTTLVRFEEFLDLTHEEFLEILEEQKEAKKKKQEEYRARRWLI